MLDCHGQAGYRYVLKGTLKLKKIAKAMIVLSFSCLREIGGPAEHYSDITLNSQFQVKQKDCKEGDFCWKEWFQLDCGESRNLEFIQLLAGSHCVFLTEGGMRIVYEKINLQGFVVWNGVREN